MLIFININNNIALTLTIIMYYNNNEILMTLINIIKFYKY